MQKVETGIADNTYIEIKSGLKPGEEVVSGSYTAICRKLKDGAKVAIEKEERKQCSCSAESSRSLGRPADCRTAD